MDLQGYEVLSDDEYVNFEFLSIGKKGIIKKIVMFRSLGFNTHNLALGDLDESTGKVNDDARTNNGDRDKILATVAEIVVDFLEHHPGATVLAIGATPVRSRLFQIVLNIIWENTRDIYLLEGYLDGEWEDFAPMKTYEAFTIKSK
jgi:hypothetical protein